MEKMKTIDIIGAGPIGSYLAYLLAKKKQQVNVYEEHKKIGKPVQCAGIVTSSIFKVLDFPINKAIINKIKIIEVHSKNQCVEFSLKKPDIIIDREKFDNLIYNQAKKAGAKFHLGKKITNFNQNKKEITVGADGPLSLVAKHIGKKQKIIPAIQVRIKTKKKIKDKSKVQVFLKPRGFLWIIPESNCIARIGMIGKDKRELMRFIKSKDKIIEWQSGIIPGYDPLSFKDDIYLVGDAAGHIKETTYGGIVPGLLGARALANSIISRRNYDCELKSLNRELWIHHQIRKFLNKFSEKDYDFLLKLAGQKKIKEILEQVDRDNMKKSIAKIFLREPRFFYFFFLTFLFPS